MIDRRIKFRHIQCFVEIAQERSLKLAADKLHLTQPAISKTLKELEEIIGASLMTRNRAGIQLTREGKVFLHFAQISLASLQQGLDGVEKESEARATLKVGVLPSVAASFMPPVIREFADLAPNVMVQIMDGPHGYLIERLKLGELDLVIGRLGRPESMEGVSFTQLYSERVDLIVRAGHPLLEKPDIKRIVDWPVIYPPDGAAIRPLVERFMIANGVGEIPNKIETVSGAFGRVYTRKTDAVWIISSGVVQNETADGHLVRLPFETDITKGPVGLMTRPDTQPGPEEQMFRLAVQTVIEELGLRS
ncbi:pca operon transcription factor PcaQ [Roseibium sediminicola]|uniref:Pca operon transcription factor PcaQ n=1 Tax=Roseibium sediminicola TaxID=2933272 RepID=A0ABT0GWR2_9HYPH|nr:pca operon transcription factor PcaQ [Roseibium sp. CAU 1639]MCK7613884.1 pca operon transcription factor PcaQ [Roseibium sp. CAU 1639]